jgi:hypothetical protein
MRLRIFQNLDLLLRIVVILVSLLHPFILLLTYGELPSMSSYWETPLQPLFIFTNASTSYFLFGLKDWKFSSIFLLLLTAFSVSLYPQLHNIFAILFFICCLYPLIMSKRFRYYSIIYSLSIIVGIFFGILWLEIYAVLVLTAYHLHTLWYKEFLISQRK